VRNTTPLAEQPSRLSGRLSWILALLGFSIFINYIDRGNLSIAAPLLKDELHLSASQLGVLLSSFFWTYAGFQIVSGWLVDRCNVNWVIAIGFFIWSSATAATGLVHTFAILLAVRLVLGMGESVAYPSYSKILVRYFPEDQRGFANAVISAGLLCGPALGMFMGGVLMARFGWRPFFIVLGLVSLLWLLPWLKWMPRGQPLSVLASSKVPSISAILKQRSAWGTFAALFCVNYLSYFFITWLPFYLVRERHFSMEKMAKITGGAYLSAAVVTTLSGWLSDRWVGAGGTPSRVRKMFTGAGMACASVFLITSVVAGPTASIVMIFLAIVSLGVCMSNVWAITQTLAGPHAAGRWTGLQNFVGNLAGVVAPALTGFVVDRTGQFFWPFAITSGFAMLGAFSWLVLIGPVKQVVWEPFSA